MVWWLAQILRHWRSNSSRKTILGQQCLAEHVRKTKTHKHCPALDWKKTKIRWHCRVHHRERLHCTKSCVDIVQPALDHSTVVASGPGEGTCHRPAPLRRPSFAAADAAEPGVEAVPHYRPTVAMEPCR